MGMINAMTYQNNKKVFDLTKHLTERRHAPGRPFNLYYEINPRPFGMWSRDGVTIYFYKATLDMNAALDIINGGYEVHQIEGAVDFLDERGGLIASFKIKTGAHNDGQLNQDLGRLLGRNLIDVIIKHGDFDDNDN